MAKIRPLLPLSWPKREHWVPEYRFHTIRKWRFDWAYIRFGNTGKNIAIEINGGIFMRGRHSRGAGQLKDWEKLNVAQSMGWQVYQFSPQQINSGEAGLFIAKILEVS